MGGPLLDVASSAAFPGASAFKILSSNVLDGTNAATSLNSTVQVTAVINAVFQ